jgi:hypothetical protein
MIGLYSNLVISDSLTNKKGNFAVLPFNGTAIAVWGSTNVDHGSFAATLDGGPSRTFSGASPVLRTHELLYWAHGLPAGNHQLMLTNTNDTYFELDYYTYTPSPNPSSTNSSDQPDPSHNDDATSTPFTADPRYRGVVVACITAACTTVLLLLALGVFCFFRRKRGRRGIDKMRRGEKADLLGDGGDGDGYVDELALPLRWGVKFQFLVAYTNEREQALDRSA